MSGEQKPSRWILAIELFKLLFLAVVSPLIVYLAATELSASLRESSPTQVQSERFADEYRGQRWLHVDGRLLPKYANVVKSDNDSAKVHVPIVPLDWKPDQAVHVVGTYSMPCSRVDDWIQDKSHSPKCTLQGYVPPGSPFHYSAMFPTLHFEEPVVYINEGGSPAPLALGLLLLAVGGFTLFLSWNLLLKLVLAWRRHRQAAALERENAERAMWS